jgi:hypothetical protein
MEVLQRAADQEEEHTKKEQAAAAEKARQDAIKKENEEKEKERLEQLAKLREQDNKRLADSTQKNIEKLKELQLKNDDIINDEKQLLELQLKRQLASIEASEADVKEKEAAQKATEDLYREQIRLSEEKYNSISEQLKRMPLTEQQIQNQQIDQFKSFLQQRTDLQFENDELLNESEVEKAEKRIEFLKEQQELLLEQFEEGSAEYLAAQQASNAKIEQEEKRLSDAKLAIKKAELKATSGLFGALADLAEAAGEDSVAAAIASKALSSAQAAINSYLAFTQALHDPMIPSTIARIAMAATVLASGLAMQVKILSTPIPSAETGGRFIVPNSTGSDSGLMRVNPGEEVDITPRGMTGFGQGQTITVQIEKKTIFDVVNDGIRSGDILIAAVNY